MKTIAISELKQLKVAELMAILPVAITKDGTVIAELKSPGEAVEDVSKYTTQCPNCKLVYQGIKPDNQPGFLSMKH